MINRGFINSPLRLLIAFGYWKREGNREYVRCQTGAVHANVECGLSSYLLRAITALENAITETRDALVINVTTLRRDCCPIVDSFEKNYRLKRPDRVREGRRGPGPEQRLRVKG
jgi:hypothetical protein